MANQENTQNAAVINKEYAMNYQDHAPKNTVILENGFGVHNLQQYENHLRRLAGELKTIDAASFFDYVLSRQSEQEEFKSRTFVNANQPDKFLQAVTVLNFGDSSGEKTAGRGDDLATLDLSKDPMFVDFLTNMVGYKFKTVKLAESLEDYLGTMDITSYSKGEHGAITTATQAFRNLKIEANQISNVNASQYKSEQSDLENFEAQAVGGELPEYIAIETPIYTGLETQTVLFKVKMHQDKENDKPVVYFELVPVALKYAYLKAGINFQNLIRHELPNEAVTIGVWTQK